METKQPRAAACQREGWKSGKGMVGVAVGRNTPGASECYFDDMSLILAHEVVGIVLDARWKGEIEERSIAVG